MNAIKWIARKETLLAVEATLRLLFALRRGLRRRP